MTSGEWLQDVILCIIVVFLWIGTSKVVIGSGRVRVHSGLLGIGPRREIPFSEIGSITMPVGMQSGGRSGTPYYDIKLKLTDGQEVTLASSIRNKLEAEWLIASIKSEIGLK
ncbi:MAG: hypothetical protein ABSB82_07580 [Terriglobia bacterium]|jgi:hypothetical protein